MPTIISLINQRPLTPPSNPICPGSNLHKHLASAWPGCLIMSPFVLLTHVCSRPEHIPPPPSLSTHVGTACISTQTAIQPIDIHLSQKGLSHTELTLSCTAQQRWDDTNKLLPWEWVVASHWGQWNKRWPKMSKSKYYIYLISSKDFVTKYNNWFNFFFDQLYKTGG